MYSSNITMQQIKINIPLKVHPAYRTDQTKEKHIPVKFCPWCFLQNYFPNYYTNMQLLHTFLNKNIDKDKF